MRAINIAFALFFLQAAPALAQSGCVDYPYTPGLNIESVEGGVKIISTQAATVMVDDIDSVNDAREEATLEAKAAIAKFMSEGIKSDSQITRAVNETRSMQGEARTATRSETIQRVKTLQNSSQALLRGVVPLGECYTRARELRVSVGIKPETISAAEGLSRGMSNSLNNQGTPGSGRGGASGSSAPAPQGPRGTDGYSDSTRVRAF